jgi:hypothetical protein
MKIKSQKDFFSGVLFMGFGIAFTWGATTYKLGQADRMGPGYFPLMLGILMTVLGILIIVKALVVKTESGDLIGGKPAEFDKFLKSEIDRWAKVVRDNKIAIGD